MNNDNHLLFSPVPYKGYFFFPLVKTEVTFLHYQLTHLYSLPLPFLEKELFT